MKAQVNLKNMSSVMEQCISSEEVQRVFNMFRDMYIYGFVDVCLWDEFCDKYSEVASQYR